MDITSCNSRNFAGVIKLRNLGERRLFWILPGWAQNHDRGPFKSRRTFKFQGCDPKKTQPDFSGFESGGRGP